MPAVLTTRRTVWGVALVLAGVSLLPRGIAGWLGSWLQPVAATALLPAAALRSIVYSGGGAGADGFTGDVLIDGEEALLVELEQLRLENKQLREELAELSEASALLVDARVEPVRARVMAVTGTSNSPTLLIARGALQGVGPGMTVVSRRNLVGRVVGDAGPTSATVEPVWAGVSSLAVVIHTSEGVGGQRRVEARVNADDAGRWATQLAADVNVQPGDAATLNDEIAYFDAAGYTLGVVDSVEPDPQDPLLLKRVTLRPAVPFSQLGRVVVLVPEG